MFFRSALQFYWCFGWKFASFLLMLTSKVDGLLSLHSNSTASCDKSPFKGYKLISTSQQQIYGCTLGGLKLANGDYHENHILHIENSAERQKIYLKIIENDTASQIPQNSSSITGRIEYRFALTSSTPLSWFVDYQPQAKRKFYVSRSSTAKTYSTENKLIPVTRTGSPNGRWRVKNERNRKQLRSTIARSAFGETNVATFIATENVDHITLVVGRLGMAGTTAPKCDVSAKPSSLYYRSARAQEIAVGECATEYRGSVGRNDSLLYILEVENNTSSTVHLRVKRSAEVTPSKMPMLMLSSSTALHWTISYPSALLPVNSLRIMVSSGSAVDNSSLVASVSSFTDQEIKLHELTQESNLKILRTKLHENTDIVEFTVGDNEALANMSLPKPSASPAQVLLFVDSPSVQCTLSHMIVNISSYAFKIYDIDSSLVVLGNGDCKSISTAEGLVLRAAFGSCGMTKVANSTTYEMKMLLRMGKGIVRSLKCKPPTYKMSVFSDVQLQDALAFPTNFSEKRQSFYVQVSDDSDQDLSLRRCYLANDSNLAIAQQHLVVDNCPFVEYVRFLSPSSDLETRQTFIISLNREVLQYKRFYIACSVFPCFEKCFHRHGSNCDVHRGRSDRYDVTTSDTIAGPFVVTEDPPLQCTSRFDSTFGDPGTSDTFDKTSGLSPAVVAVIAASSFVAGIIIVALVWKIRSKRQSPPARHPPSDCRQMDLTYEAVSQYDRSLHNYVSVNDIERVSSATHSDNVRCITSSKVPDSVPQIVEPSDDMTSSSDPNISPPITGADSGVSSDTTSRSSVTSHKTASTSDPLDRLSETEL